MQADVYASSKTAVCATYHEPPAQPFATAEAVLEPGKAPTVYWIHCPKSLQPEYIRLYKRHKLTSQGVGACVLLPYKLPVSKVDLVKGMRLLHVYSRNTLLFADPVTGNTVRSRCTMARW